MKTKANTARRTSARKEATAEQKEAARIRREGIKQICAIVKALTPEKRVLLASSYGIRTAEGRELSPYNQCLLVHQNSSVSIVGGFQQWKKLGRSVKKGERALAIWVPCGKPGENAEAPDTNPDTDNDRSFIIGNVFDITQTETEDEKARRIAGETPALPAPRLALPYRSEAVEVEAEALPNGPADYRADTGLSWTDATPAERAEYLADPEETPATTQGEFILCD